MLIKEIIMTQCYNLHYTAARVSLSESWSLIRLSVIKLLSLLCLGSKTVMISRCLDIWKVVDCLCSSFLFCVCCCAHQSRVIVICDSSTDNFWRLKMLLFLLNVWLLLLLLVLVLHIYNTSFIFKFQKIQDTKNFDTIQCQNTAFSLHSYLCLYLYLCSPADLRLECLCHVV